MDYFKLLYDAASLNDACQLNKLLQQETEPSNLENVLSKVCMELQLNCVHLTDDTKLILDRKLLNLRFFYQPSNIRLSSQKICDRIRFTIKLIHDLHTCEDNNELFLVNLTFIAKQIFILKKILKSTYDRVPWEEIEFCVLCYIMTFREPSDIVLFSRAILSKLNIINYITIFGSHLKKLEEYVLMVKLQELNKFPNLTRGEVINGIIEKYPEFKFLYNDYELLRDIQSLSIMNNYAELVESIEVGEKNCILILVRALQVIGEHLKNTLESPKLSQTTISYLLASFSGSTRDVMIKLRNKLSHNQFPSKREEFLESIDSDLSIGIKSDIRKVGSEISYILLKYKIRILRELGEKFLNTDDEEVMKEVAYVMKNIEISKLWKRNISQMKNNDVSRLKDLICLFRDKMTLKSNYCKFLFASIDSILKEYPQEKTIDYYGALISFNGVYEIFYLFMDMVPDKSDYIRNVKFFMKQNLSNLSSQIEPFKWNKIVEMLISINSLLPDESEDAQIIILFQKIIHIAKFEINNATWAEKFERKLSRKENKKEILSEKVVEVSNNQIHMKLAQLRKIFSGVTYSGYKKNKNLHAVIEILLLDLIPMLKYSNFKSRLFFLDENYPTIMGLDLRNHLAHNNIIINVLLDLDAAVFLFVETLLKVEGNQKFNLQDFRHYNIIDIEKTYFNSIDTSRKKLEMFIALKENNFEAFCKCLETGADIRSRDIDMYTCLHFAVNKPGTMKLIKFLSKQSLSSKLKNLDGQTPLHIAALKGNLEVVEFLLNNFDFEVNDVDLFKRTASHFAALSGNEHVLNILLDHGADLTKKDHWGYSPLLYAVMSGKNAIIEIFFRRNLFYKLNGCFSGFTSLHLAAQYGLNEVVDYLLSKKLKVDVRQDRGGTPLHLAALNGHLEIVEALIRFGADVNSRNMNGCGAMHWACETNREEIVKVLIKHGADINITDHRKGFAPIHYVTEDGFVSILEILLANNANVNLATNCHRTPLFLAVEGRHLKVVEIVLKQKDVEVNSPDVTGRTPLHLAASNGDLEIAGLLIKNGARVNCKSEDGKNPLHLAAKYGHEAIVDLLIANRVSAQAITMNGISPLHLAAESGNENIIKKLITEGSDINATTLNGLNCLHIAIKNDRNILDLLLHEGVKVNVKTKDNGFTPLHEAVLKNNLKVVETLVKAGSHIDAKDGSGNTPLHLAVERESSEICLFLLENGANIALENKMGETPFLKAVKHNMIKFVQLCMSSGLIDDEVIRESMEMAISEGKTNILKFLLKETEIDLTNFRDSEENTLLHGAALLGKVDSLEVLLKHGNGVNSKNESDQTPLHLAAIGGCEDVLEILLENGAHINIQDCEGATPLHEVSFYNNPKCAQILLDQGADANIPDVNNMLAVELAATAGHLEMIKLFLKINKDYLNRKGYADFTLLHIAAQCGQSKVVKFLLSEGADMNSKIEMGLMPVHFAAGLGFTDIINIFVEEGMSLDVCGKDSLLHYAAHNGNIEVVKFLVEKGFNINSVNDQGITPLHIAIKEGYKEVVEFLLNNAAICNINRPIEEVLETFTDENNKLMFTSIINLFSSIRAGNMAKIKEFIRGGVPLNCVDINKGSPLHFAVYKGNVGVVELLLRNKVLTNTTHRNGWTPLHYAVKYSYDKIVFLLLWHGAKYDIHSDNGQKPIDFAKNGSVHRLLQLINDCFEGIKKKNSNIIDRLKKLKNKDVLRAVMRAENKQGSTLMTAAIKNKYSRIKELEEIFEENVHIQFDIANGFIDQEKYEEACEVYLSIYQKRRDIYGDDNPATLSIKSKMANMWYKLHLYEQALTSMEETYQKLKDILGVDHESTLRTRSNIALILHRQDKNKESLKIFEEVHEIQKRLLPPEHADSLSTKIDMALVLMSMNKLDRALKLYNAVLKIEEKKIGIINSRTISVKNNIAIIFLQQGKNDEAFKLFREVYELRKSMFGPYHSDTLRVLQKQISILNIQEKYDEAYEEYKKLLECQKRHLGQHHLDTLDTQFQMAHILLKQSKFFSAFKILKGIKDHKMAIQGVDHKEVVFITERLEIIETSFQSFGLNSNLNGFIEDMIDTMNEAAKRGDVDTIEELLRSGVDVGDKDVEGRNSLHYAVDGNNIEVVKLLLENNADLTEKTNKGDTVLHTACNKGYQDITQLILNTVNANNLSYLINAATNVSKMTALHLAAKEGFIEIVRILLKKGAIYDCVNKDGKTPRDLAEDESVRNILQLTEDLFVAFKSGDFSVMSKLNKLEKNDFSCVTNAKDLQNCTLLNLLILNRQMGLGRNLIERMKMNNVEGNRI